MEPADRAATVWSRMADTFGADFLRRFGSEPSHEWDRLVRRLTDVQIDRAFDAMVDEGLTRAPSLPQFAALARKALARTHDPEPAGPQRDLFERAANKAYLKACMDWRGFPKDRIDPMLARARVLVADFRAMQEDGEDVAHFPPLVYDELVKIAKGRAAA